MKRGMRALATLLACALVLAMTLAMLRAGETYFACMQMGSMSSMGRGAEHACCAARTKKEAPRDAQCHTRTPGCCERLAADGLRMVHAAPAPHVETAPLLGVLPPAPIVPYEPSELRTASRMARAGPPPRAPTPSFLSVYLI
ncbi:hypothetical protein LVJ94_19255 [Pendulispora rubella]|uniref:Uncharacterized protein n=1 Tax=Pendulispora rubella TaxID=2741070 RepID=A0ABZ2LJM7_9BACT